MAPGESRGTQCLEVLRDVGDSEFVWRIHEHQIPERAGRGEERLHGLPGCLDGRLLAARRLFQDARSVELARLDGAVDQGDVCGAT